MDTIVNLCKQRGFVFPGSDIYGGLANTWDYGPLGVELLNNIKQAWWKRFVTSREDMYGIDSGIIMNPKIWEASGHVDAFHDPLVECKKCHKRFRADHLVEEQLGESIEGKSLKELDAIIQAADLACVNCKAQEFGSARTFNLLFKTFIGPAEDSKSVAYLRGETAQGMFVNFKNILDTMRPKLPFGMAQIGKAFRNEITPGNFIFRTLEFEQMEIEYFVKEGEWEKWFDYWQKEMDEWVQSLGILKEEYKIREHDKDELSHYSKKTIDFEYDFPFGGFKELYGLAYRTDFDLKNHIEKSGVDLQYFNQQEGEKFIPHVIEPTFGVGRTFLATLLSAYTEEDAPSAKGGTEKRVVLKLPKHLAPYQVAVLPLSKKEELSSVAKELFKGLSSDFSTEYDETQSIGKRYRRQDEIGTPYCITVDFESLEDNAVTVRDRDTMTQERVNMNELKTVLKEKLA
ncbi:glycine--tRNA ligase [Patescibacteria group bacterium]|nr:glycine--tRNA ligase [Patescibacteria group bacterium]